MVYPTFLWVYIDYKAELPEEDPRRRATYRRFGWRTAQPWRKICFADERFRPLCVNRAGKVTFFVEVQLED